MLRERLGPISYPNLSLMSALTSNITNIGLGIRCEQAVHEYSVSLSPIIGYYLVSKINYYYKIASRYFQLVSHVFTIALSTAANANEWN